MWKSQDITIPEFQREFVWNIRQSSLLMESFLLGLPVPPVFFYIDDENKNLVIDGQQRILSTVFYFEGYFGLENIHGKRQVFRLQGLDKKSPYYNKKYDELSDSDERKLKNTVLRAINIRQVSPTGDKTSIYHIFERLNTGGTPLKPQEIRNVVFRGEIVRILRELNKDPNWRQILGKTTYDKHQKDVELVLRLFALSQKSDEYENPMKEFLNKAMEQNKKGDTKGILKFEKLFIKTSDLIINMLGPKPFHVRGPLNTAFLDSVFCTLLNNINKIPDNLSERFKQLKKDRKINDVTTTSTTNTQIVRERFRLVKEYLID
ncbi:MAG TPA: DUF262 domain-containing protein [Thermodesulfobacteriota bacterium]|nr:DUF262 domain-containing protein [Thermodesulfobacteriota bacterium]